MSGQISADGIGFARVSRGLPLGRLIQGSPGCLCAACSFCNAALCHPCSGSGLRCARRSSVKVSPLFCRHNTYLQECTGQREPTYQLNVHDIKLLFLRFAMEQSFSIDTGGGGRESNIHLIPYIIHTVLYVLNTSVPPSPCPPSALSAAVWALLCARGSKDGKSHKVLGGTGLHILSRLLRIYIVGSEAWTCRITGSLLSKSNWELASLSILDVIITSGVSNRVITLKKLCQLNFLLSRQKRHCDEVIVS